MNKIELLSLLHIKENNNHGTTIQRFIDNMEDSKTFTEKRKKAIKLIIYNNRDKTTNEIVSNLEIYI